MAITPKTNDVIAKRLFLGRSVIDVHAADSIATDADALVSVEAVAIDAVGSDIFSNGAVAVTAVEPMVIDDVGMVTFVAFG